MDVAKARSLWTWALGGTVLLALSAATLLGADWLRWGVWNSKVILSLFVAGNMVAGTAYLWVVWRGRFDTTTRSEWLGILLVGAAMRLLLLTSTPIWETDYYRYLWDGAQVAHGLSPYLYSPEEIRAARDTGRPLPGEREALVRHGGDTIDGINHPSVRTLYPPAAQAAFALAYRLSPWSVTAWRCVLLGADLATAGLLLLLLRRLGLPILFVAFYWWNPLVVKEFYSSAHLDALVLPLVMGALLATQWDRRTWAVSLLAIGVGVKLWPVILLPLVLSGTRGRYKVAAITLFALLTAVILWPMLLAGTGAMSGAHLYAATWEANDGIFWLLATIWKGILWVMHMDPTLAQPIARTLTAIALGGWLLWLCRRIRQGETDLPEAFLLAVAGLFMLSPTQFPWYYTWLIPLLAIRPRLSLLLYTVLLPLYHLHYDVPALIAAEHLPVYWLVAYEVVKARRPKITSVNNEVSAIPASLSTSLPASLSVAVIIPALNEEKAISAVLSDIPSWVSQVIVVDNGSTDRTAHVARAGGARVIAEQRRGYGQACLSGIAALKPCDVVVFIDADYSDRASEMPALLAPILADRADLVIGSRTRGQREAGSLTPQQRFGNRLACWLIHLLYRVRFTDLGPFRAIRHTALVGLQMDDANYGWTVQMQTRAVRLGLRCTEVPVSYHRRVGTSKVSGTLRGVWGAGTCIIRTIFQEALRRRQPVHRVIVFARYPQPGTTKTRLIPALGPEGAANLHRQMVHITLHTATIAAARTAGNVEVRFTGGSARQMSDAFGSAGLYREQASGDLGARMHQALTQAFAEGASRAAVIGTDCPRLSADILATSLERLTHHDLVLGPAQDGGYYLIAMCHPIPELFAGIDWGTSQVRTQTLAIAQTLGLKVHLLPVLPDVDSADNLQNIASVASEVLASSDNPATISVIIPALNEEPRIAAAIASAVNAPNIQVIVVDGQSTDRTAQIARLCGATVLSCPPSRGRQQSLGASVVRGDILLFLHADTALPPGWAEQVRHCVGDHPNAAGAFRLGFDAPGWRFRAMERIVHWRSTWLQLPYGDQALFMSARLYAQIGGFPDMPSMEDYALVRTLARHHPIRILPATATSSARRWVERGILRTTGQYQWLILMYHLRRLLDPSSLVQ